MMNTLKAVIRWAMAAETPTLPEMNYSTLCAAKDGVSRGE